MKDELINSLEARKAKLTPQTAKQVFFHSFYFSQGSPVMQQTLFRYIHTIRPQWRIDPQIYEFLLSLEDTALKLHGHGMHAAFINGEKGLGEIELQADMMVKVFNKVSMADPPADSFCGTLLEMMIERDFEYLCHQRGRPGRSRGYAIPYGSEDYSIFKDPLLSHLCHFCILGNKCHVAEFDELCSMLGYHLASSAQLFEDRVFQHDTLKEKLRGVVEVFNASHATSIRFDSARPEL